MKWLNLETKIFRSEEFLGCDPVQRATWVCLIAYCALSENGGVIPSCFNWSDRKWEQVIGVTKMEVKTSCDLYRWDGENLVVMFYPKAQEKETAIKSISGKLGGRGGLNKDQLAFVKSEISIDVLVSLTDIDIQQLRHSRDNSLQLAELIAELGGNSKCKGKSKGNSKCNDNHRARVENKNNLIPQPPSPPKENGVPPTVKEAESWGKEWGVKNSKDAIACGVVAVDAWKFYTRTGWLDRNKKPVVDWKFRFSGTWMTDEKIAKAGASRQETVGLR